jgi:4-hydroxy-2,2'-bipyrrole-5-carbaldehyde O-methyltransferase
MSIKPFLTLMRNHQLGAMTGSNALLKPFYQLNYLVAAKECGLFELLLDTPKGFEQLAAIFCAEDEAKTREALEAWLSLGVRLGLLRLDSRGYALKGLAKKLALPQNDAALAWLQEAAGLHSKLISHTLTKLRVGELFNLDDQDGEIIARSSRIFETFQTEACLRSAVAPAFTSSTPQTEIRL